jgi:hypothetical protein
MSRIIILLPVPPPPPKGSNFWWCVLSVLSLLVFLVFNDLGRMQ